MATGQQLFVVRTLHSLVEKVRMMRAKTLDQRIEKLIETLTYDVRKEARAIWQRDENNYKLAQPVIDGLQQASIHLVKARAALQTYNDAIDTVGCNNCGHINPLQTYCGSCGREL